jgi:hypothetical protein
LPARLAALVLLLVGGVAALLLAVRLAAALAGWRGGSWHLVTQGLGLYLTVIVLVLGILVLALLISLLPGRRRRVAWLAAERGGVLVSLDALQHIVAASVGQHPDVVRAQVQLRRADGAPGGRLRLWLRPLSAEQVGAEIGRAAQAELQELLGRRLAHFQIEPHVLRVEQLKRYLS